MANMGLVAAAAPVENIPNWFVVCMGVGTVFIGLISIIVICSIVGLFFRGKKEAVAPCPPPAPAEETENRQEILAAVTAAIAEELGTDVSALRVHSFKRL